MRPMPIVAIVAGLVGYTWLWDNPGIVDKLATGMLVLLFGTFILIGFLLPAVPKRRAH